MGDVKMLRLRRDDRCACGTELSRGTRAGWDRTRRVVVCEPCVGAVAPSVQGRRRGPVAAEAGPVSVDLAAGRRRRAEPAPPPVEVGVPGRSLIGEFERRRAAEEAEIRARHRFLGGWIVRRTPPSSTTRSFAVGAEGEMTLAQELADELGDAALWLFNRRPGVGRQRGDIDLLAVVPSGVWVIDSKHYAGRTVVATREAITVDGRRRALTESINRQVGAVGSAVPEVPRFPVLCFVGARVEVQAARADGIVVADPPRLAGLLGRAGPMDAATCAEVHRRLAAALPPA